MDNSKRGKFRIYIYSVQETEGKKFSLKQNYQLNVSELAAKEKR